jgi:CubicO group peptidase (beta-lactamase class C family)
MNTNLLVIAGAVSLVLIGAGSAKAAEALPAQGQFEPGLEAFDVATQTFMAKNRISAGQVAIMRNGEVIFDRTYGWQDQKQGKVLKVGALMRIASVTKPFTAAVIRKLIDAKQLSLDTHVFSLGQPGGGVLDLDPPAFGALDPRLKDVTIEHCLLHKGGWDRGPDSSNDLTYFEIKAAKALHMPSPPGKIDMARYIIRQPLQFDPGSRRVYSNVGYLMLGLVIEKLTGRDYLAYLHENVTRPAGVSDKDLVLASSFRKDADPREPYYDDPQLRPNVFYPAYSRVPKVEAPYGSFNMEARTSEGRIITTARSLILFLNKVHRQRPQYRYAARSTRELEVQPSWQAIRLRGASSCARRRHQLRHHLQQGPSIQ